MKATWFEELQKAAKGSIDYEYEKIVLDITETIIKVLHRKGWNRVELARKLNVKPSYVTKLLRGSNLTIKQMLRVCNILDCNLDITVNETESVRKNKVIDWAEVLQRRSKACNAGTGFINFSKYARIQTKGANADVIAA